MDYLPCEAAPIHPLLNRLSFIEVNWGWIFRRGHFEISRDDFQVIADAMQVKF